jgi:HSP20 family protein
VVNLMRQDPLMGTLPAARMMDRLMERFFNEPFTADGGVGGLLEEATGTLALDVAEDEKTVIVRASLPGFKNDEIDVEVQNGVLSINAQHKEEHEEKGERYVRRERRFGSVSRRIALPIHVKEDECEAELSNGVLTLRIPRSEEAMPRKIRIREGEAGRQGVPRR